MGSVWVWSRAQLTAGLVDVYVQRALSVKTQSVFALWGPAARHLLGLPQQQR